MQLHTLFQMIPDFIA
jgi:hypothetical protein